MKKIIENLPFWFFWLVVFSLPFVNFPNLRNFGFSIQTTDILFVLTGLIWLLYLILRKNRIRFSWFYLPLVIYFLSSCLSTIYSEERKTSIIKLFGNILLIGLSVLAFNLADDHKKLRKIGMAWLSATFLVCFVSVASLILFYIQRDNPILLETLSHYGSLPTGNYARIQSTFFNPNMMCNYLNISVGFGVLAYKFKWLTREVLGIFTVLFALATFFTLSPGIGGILLTVGLWFWLDLKLIKPLFAKLLLVGGILGAVFFFLTVLPSPTNFPSKFEPSPRVLTWSSALETLKKYPILGRGIGLDAGYVEYDSPNGKQFLGDAHQLWLNIAAQQGLIGLTIIIFLTGWFFRKSLPLNSDKTPFKTALGLAFIGTFCYQGLIGSYEDARHLWVLLGLLASASEIEENI